MTKGSAITTEYRITAGWEKLLNWSVRMANITMTAMKNADTTAMMSSLLASFSPPVLYDMPVGN
jgi:hypothetical protein